MTSETDSNNLKRHLRILALHGSEGSAQEFTHRLQPLQSQLFPQLIQINSFDAPFINGNGFSWWKLPPGVRSYNAEIYPGFDTSLDVLVQQINNVVPDLVVAHSQGAIFIAALLALQHTSIPTTATTTTMTTTTQSQLLQQLPKQHPSLGYILNGLAWPNPFTEQFFKLVQSSSSSSEAAAVTAAATGTATTPAVGKSSLEKPRILVLVGTEDTINPPSSAERVVQHFRQAGFPINTLYHDGGHSLPFRNETCVAAVADWIQQGLSTLS